MSKVQEVMELVKGMTVLELAELVKAAKKNLASVRCSGSYGRHACCCRPAADDADEQVEFDATVSPLSATKRSSYQGRPRNHRSRPQRS